MTKKINSILAEVLEKVEPPKRELEIIENSLKEFLEKFKKKLKNLKIDAEVFVGGSFAKKTVIKKDNYDIDVFIRFDKKYKDLSNLCEDLLKNIDVGKIIKIHGSRDYFCVGKGPKFFIEIIPVLKIKNSKQAENITDLSYAHVKYINKKIKKKTLEDVRLAKAFCYANNCYGAESYIQGFSGYALELLICYYGSFLKFIKAMPRIKDKKVIDIEKHHKNKQSVLMDLNSSKLQSPIVLIDPTYKQRNVLAALSEETFAKFQKDCEAFLKSPSIKSFELKKTDLEKVNQNAKKKNFEFILIETKTNKQEGDVAGSKLLKFYKHIGYEMNKFFEIKNKGFNYNGKKSARCFFVVKNKKEILIGGPSVKDKKNILAFKKKHRSYFIKKNKIYAREKIKFNIKEFIDGWKKKNKKRLKEMYVEKLEVVE